MSIEAEDDLAERKRQIWLNLLGERQNDYLLARDSRLSTIHAARREGLTYADIAPTVGMTQSGVRMLLARAGDA